ncbi:MAG: ester cyclase [Chloroflexota bacterium]|nr:ester cyclase [Chloroflexota bacterium]
MTLEDNKYLVLRFARNVFDEGSIDDVSRYLAPDFFNHATGLAGVDHYKETIRAARKLLNAPNVVDQVLADGDLVLQGIRYQPTGRTFSTQHVHLFRLRDNAIVEHRAIRDDFSMLKQLGIVTLATPD